MKFKNRLFRLAAAVMAALMLVGCTPAKTAPAPNASQSEPQGETALAPDDGMLAFRPAECGILPQAEFVYPYTGMKLALPQEMLDKMASYDVLMLSDEGYTADAKLQFGILSWYALTEEQKTEEFTAFDPDAWISGLSRIGTIGVYDGDAVSELDMLTGCTNHTELAKSADGAYTYYLSITDDADSTLLSQTVLTATEMTPLDLYMGKTAFSEARIDAENVGTFTTADIYGTEYTNELFAGSTLTLVNVFATWCVPCINEMPELEQLRKDMEEMGVNVITVVLDSVQNGTVNEDTVAVAKRLYHKLHLTLPMLIPDETMMNGRLQGIDSIPESFFVDSEGNIVGDTYVGARSLKQWKQIVETELENLLAQ